MPMYMYMYIQICITYVHIIVHILVYVCIYIYRRVYRYGDRNREKERERHRRASLLSSCQGHLAAAEAAIQAKQLHLEVSAPQLKVVQRATIIDRAPYDVQLGTFILSSYNLLETNIGSY